MQPTIFAIFGVTGDLAKQKIFPALIDLFQRGMLPERFEIVGISRRSFSHDEFRAFIHQALLKKKEYSPDTLSSFLAHIRYQEGQFDSDQTYLKTKETLNATDERWGQCSNKLLYLSVPPSLYELILQNIYKSGLSEPCAEATGWARILIEKPFGKDEKTAQELDVLLGKLFKEEQIYRIDHYLAKQTLQNILTFRFSNTLFEPLWNRDHIQSVEINLFEDKTARGRGAFYDDTGALRDVGQNHLLQMLALVAMEQPQTVDSTGVREQREKVLSRLRRYTKRSLSKQVFKAQYDGFLLEEGVNTRSQTETFFAVTAFVDNSRWRNVPFYLRSGKALAESRVEIVINFKDETPGSFMPIQYKHQEVNKLTFSVQPHERISMLFWVRKPGFENRIEPRELTFSYGNEEPKIDAYEKVLFDVIAGDQTSFVSTREVATSWKFISSILDNWSELPLYTYGVGSDPLKR